MENTVDNKKIILTNRTALAVLLFVIGTTFSATIFYSQTQYQALVASQNAERINKTEERIKEVQEMLEIRIEVNHKQEIEYFKQEIDGLRADWERDRIDQNKLIDKLK